MVLYERFHVFEFDEMSPPYPSPSTNYKSNEQAYLYKCRNCGKTGITLVFGDEKYEGDLDYAAAGRPFRLRYDRLNCESDKAPRIWFFSLRDHNCLVNRNRLFK